MPLASSIPEASGSLLFAFLQKLDHVTHEAFSAHWRGQHARLAAGVPHFWRRNRRYVQNHVLATWPPQSEPAWDGIVEMHEWPGAQDLHHLRQDPEFLARVETDERLFLRQDRLMRMGVRSRTLVEGPALGLKCLTLVRKSPEAGPAALQAWLSGARVQAARAELGPVAIQRWELHIAVPGTGVAWFDHGGYDAIEAIWLQAGCGDAEPVMSALHESFRDGVVAQAQVHTVEQVEIARP